MPGARAGKSPDDDEVETVLLTPRGYGQRMDH